MKHAYPNLALWCLFVLSTSEIRFDEPNNETLTWGRTRLGVESHPQRKVSLSHCFCFYFMFSFFSKKKKIFYFFCSWLHCNPASIILKLHISHHIYKKRICVRQTFLLSCFQHKKESKQRQIKRKGKVNESNSEREGSLLWKHVNPTTPLQAMVIDQTPVY